MLIYMDCCCLNRPNDDQTQDRIRIESDVIIAILSKCLYGLWELVGSDIIEYEIMKTPDLNKRNRTLDLYKVKSESIIMNDAILERAKKIRKHGIKSMDSLHFASAECRNVDILLTVDREFLTNAKKIDTLLEVANPVNWFMEEMGNG